MKTIKMPDEIKIGILVKWWTIQFVKVMDWIAPALCIFISPRHVERFVKWVVLNYGYRYY